MEKDNQLTMSQQNIVVSSRIKELGSAVYRVNQMVTFSLNKTQIEDWSASINKIHPGITLKTLDLIIDRLMTGEYEWDSRLAIQNVFNGIKEYLKELKAIEDKAYDEIRGIADEHGISEDEAAYLIEQGKKSRNESHNE